MERTRKPRKDAVCSIFLPEEIVTKILQRLHIRPLFRFKCVSKQWNSIISDPKFGQCYMQRANSSPESRSSWRLWGVIYPLVSSASDPPIQNSRFSSKSASTLSENDHAPPSLYVPPSLHPRTSNKNLLTLCSSNGLILSLLPPQSPFDGEFKVVLCVSNPLTKQSTRLPLVYFPNLDWEFGLATRTGQLVGENRAYVTYKVVIIGVGLVMIFSSDTGRWTSTKLINCPPIYRRGPYTDTFTSKGVLHWFVWGSRSIVTYDPYESPGRFGSIQLPNGSDTIMRNYTGVNLIHLGDEDMIEFGDMENNPHLRMRVWRLVDHAKGEWRLDRTCVVYQGYKHRLVGCEWRKLVAPDPRNGELFCCFDTHNKERLIKAVDVGSGERVFVDASEARTTATPSGYYMNYVVPINLCPWSSPFYGGARSCSSSSVLGFIKIPYVWFPSFDR